MNLLQLANDFILESESLDSVVSVQGDDFDVQQLSMWIRDAWVDIQASRRWNFMWAEGSFSTLIGKDSYSPFDVGIDPQAEYNTKLVFLTDSQGRVNKIPFKKYNQCRETLKTSPRVGPPRFCTIKPDNSLVFYPTPSEVYNVDFDYFKAPQILVEDTDEPNFPQKHHKIITYKALEHYAREQGQEWNGLYQAAIRNYNKVYSRMLNDETGEVYIQREF